DLLAVDRPFVAVEARRGGDRGEVGAGAGFGIALAPQFADGADAGQEALLLRLGAEGQHGRAQQFLTHVRDPRGGVGLGVFLVEDDLLPHAGFAAAVLLRPAQTSPARRRQMTVPGQPLVERLVLAAGAAETAQVLVLAVQVLREPGADLGA